MPRGSLRRGSASIITDVRPNLSTCTPRFCECSRGLTCAGTGGSLQAGTTRIGATQPWTASPCRLRSPPRPSFSTILAAQSHRLHESGASSSQPLSTMPPTLSVVVAAYNVEEYVEKTVESLLAQSRQATEIIIVNDGSTDRTRRVLERFASVSNVVIIDTVNQGLGPARNIGIEWASGDYIAFVDGDDMVSRDYVHTIVTSAMSEALGQPDVIAFSADAFASNNYPGPLTIQRRHLAADVSGTGIAVTLLQASRSLYLPSWMYAWRRQFVELHSMRFLPILHEDWAFTIPLLCSATSIVIRENTLYHWRRRPGSITTSEISKAHVEGMGAALSFMIEYATRELTLSSLERAAVNQVLRERLSIYIERCHETGIRADPKLAFRALQLNCAWRNVRRVARATAPLKVAKLYRRMATVLRVGSDLTQENDGSRH
jgi:glycosyltransferase involved in cell wall biosynthesis